MSSYQTIWEQYNFTGKVIEILSRFPSPQNDRDDEPTFLTAYQLAIELKEGYIAGIDIPDWPVGGEGLGEHNSLAQYLARYLPPKVRNGEIDGIRVAYISHEHMNALAFSTRSGPVRATTLSSEKTQTIFAYIGTA